MTIIKKLLILLASAIVTYSVLYSTESLSDKHIQPARWSFYSQIAKEKVQKRISPAIDLTYMPSRKIEKEEKKANNQTSNAEKINMSSTVMPSATTPTNSNTVAIHQSLSSYLSRERTKHQNHIGYNYLPFERRSISSLSKRTQRDDNNIGSYDITAINSGFAAAPNLQGGDGATAIDPGKNNPTTKIPVGNGIWVMLIMAVSYAAIRFRK